MYESSALVLAGGVVPGRLIPVPRVITANCGMAWSAPKDREAEISDAAEQNGIRIAGTYFMIL